MRIQPLLSLLPLGLLLAGCNSSVAGVWMLEVAYPVEDTCTESLNHNFTGAYVAGEDEEEDDGWTEESSATHTDQLLFAQIESTGKDTAVLVMGNEAWPGVKNAKGSYTFSWHGQDDVLEDDSHASGYNYTYSNTALSEEQIVMTIDQGYGSGTWEATSTSEQSWRETDLWTEELRFPVGSIPSGSYLVIEEGKGPKATEVPATNTREGVDCDGDNCSLSVSTSCEGSLDLLLTQTDYSDEAVYDYLRNNGQGYGAN